MVFGLFPSKLHHG
ncbi:Protein of unknown function [Bacillus cytotoxicus]|uniref:Uncharacterized protein n=1 Tax=Bacillus cytotoxicus TaxID=580165 RepID=A0AAX2CD14_9BACI|nr:Protein of unknown function [Bacillus cytotoxicus]